MIEERRAEIERSIENLRYDREVLRELYHQVDGIVSDKALSDIIFGIHLTELRIETLRKQLPPPMSQRQLRALEEIPKAWAEVTDKKVGGEYLWERMDKAREEALCKAADETLQEYADIAAGRIFIDDDNVAHVNGTIETPRMVIEEAPRRTGRTFRNWLYNYFK